MNKGKKFLSELKLFTDYLKWDDKKGRYETWEEAYDQILDKQHIKKYGKKIKPYIDFVRPLVHSKAVLASQRNLQFREEQIFKNNARIFNCSVMYSNSPDMFKKGFYMLLSGAGLGVNLKKQFYSQLPPIDKRGEETVTYVIEDSVEGWCNASHVLISSYCKHVSLESQYYGKKIRFDYSLIRPRGTFISGGFKAPGHEGLQNSLEKIENYLDSHLGEFKSLTVYNILMHISDAVLSGGIRRSAMNIIFDFDDKELLYAKTGSWRTENPHYARSNNSVGLIKGEFTKEDFQTIIDLNKGDNDVGFVFLSSFSQIFNPCYEASFDFYNQIKDKNYTVIQTCNLCEVNAAYSLNKDGTMNEKIFMKQLKAAAILGTLQAGYTDFEFLGKETEDIVKGEALLGVSITGWMDNLNLFDADLLRRGVDLIRETNKEVAKVIGINPTARLTCVKPSGNSSVILGTASGIHPEHSKRYFRVMQINKDSTTSKWLVEKYPDMIEESDWSANKTDNVIYVPVENEFGKFKDTLGDIEHLKMIELVQKNWVAYGTNEENAYEKGHTHNVSNTVLIDDRQKIVDYLYENQDNFTAVSFLERTGDKDYVQAPFTSVLTAEELLKEYGDAAILASGLIVDGLNCFNDNLWDACTIFENDVPFQASRTMVLLQKDWIRRVKKFAKNFFDGDRKKTIYCMKDVHLYHKWKTINRQFKTVPKFAEILPKPEFVSIDTMGAIACSGNQCEII